MATEKDICYSKEVSENILVESPYRLLRLLTGLPVNSFAKKIGVSHTYWNDLEAGRRKGASEEIKERVGNILGLPGRTVDIILKSDRTKSQQLYMFLISAIDNYVTENRMK